MIAIKGSHIKFEMANGELLSLPSSYGIIHDPDGQDIPRCHVYFGPYKTERGDVELSSAAKAYFGDNYRGTRAIVDLPEGTWNPVGEVVQIFYRRPAGTRIAKYAGKYHHPFKRVHPVLLKQHGGRFFKFDLPAFCIYDDRGFVFP